MMTHDEFEVSAKKFCDEFNARLAATQDRNEIEALHRLLRKNMDEVRKLPIALTEGAMQRLIDVQQKMERNPLTDEQIHDCFQQKHKDKVIERRMIARAIEQAHGIGGEE